MGVIAELRKRSWLVVAAIGISLFAFLISSIDNSNNSIFGGNKMPEFASINGVEITPEQFDVKLNDAFTNYLVQQRQLVNYRSGNYTIDEQTGEQIRVNAWNEFVNEQLLAEQLEKLGIKLTQDEINNLVYGTDPHPYFKNYFTALSPDGKYNPVAVKQYYDQVSNQEVWKDNPQAMEAYYDFIMRENLAKQDYLQGKYLALFSKADYVPQWMVKNNYNIINRRVNFDYIDIQYATIPDSTIAVSEKDMKDYFERNKNKYKQKQETRVVEYIVWDFIPTAADSTAILANLRDEMDKMKSAKSDSAYISVHSEDPQRISFSYLGKSELYETGTDSSIVDSLFSKPIGSAIGPYKQNGYYKVASIRDRITAPDSSDVQLLLVDNKQLRNDEQAKKLADSLLTVLAAGASFDSLAMQYSDDQQTGAAGGSLGWITPANGLYKPIRDFVFTTGSINKPAIIKTPAGYNIINIKEQKSRREFVNIYYLSKEILASKNTTDSIDQKANAFFHNHKTKETFEQGVKENNLPKRTTQPLDKNDYEIAGLPDSKQIVNWAFANEKGSFEYFSLTEKVVVAYLKDVRQKGVPDYEDVQEQVKNETIRELKGKQLTQQLQDALSAGGDFASIAQKVGSTVKSVPNASLGTPSAPVIGREPKVIGTVLGTTQGQQTKVIAGNRGVYVANVTAITEPAATEDYSLNQNQLTSQLRSKMGVQNVTQNLVDKSDLVDNRNIYRQ